LVSFTVNISLIHISTKEKEAKRKLTVITVFIINNQSANLKGGPVYELIESVKGVGPAIATEILIVTNEFKNISDPKKFAASAVRLSCRSCPIFLFIRPIQRQGQNQ